MMTSHSLKCSPSPPVSLSKTPAFINKYQVVAVYEDRDRLARDLHDTVIQRLFGVGLNLQSMAGRAPRDMSAGLAKAVAEIDRVDPIGSAPPSINWAWRWRIEAFGITSFHWSKS